MPTVKHYEYTCQLCGMRVPYAEYVPACYACKRVYCGNCASGDFCKDCYAALPEGPRNAYMDALVRTNKHRKQATWSCWIGIILVVPMMVLFAQDNFSTVVLPYMLVAFGTWAVFKILAGASARKARTSLGLVKQK